MIEGEGDFIDAAGKFKARQDAVKKQPPMSDKDAIVDYMPTPEKDLERLNAIIAAYNKWVQPILDILEKAEYKAEMHELSEDCVEALWQGQSEEEVRTIAELGLRNIDAVLYAISLGRPPEAD